MKAFKKILATVLCVVMVFGSAPLAGFVGIELPNLFSVKAKAYDGKCGPNLTYSYSTKDYVLKIEGTGDMYDYESDSHAPWYNSRDKFTGLVIAPTVTSIGSHAFYDCNRITSVNIPDSVTKIGSWAFDSCNGITYITIGDGLSVLDRTAFANCGNILNITIGKNVVDMNGCFFYESNLNRISVHPDNPAYSSDEDGVLYNKDKTVLLKYTGGNLKNEYSVLDGVKTIGEYAFCEIDNLEKIVFPDSLEIIEDYAFWCATKINSIDFGNNLKKIGDSAFNCIWNYGNLETLVFPNSLESIGTNAFYDHTKLKSIVIGDDIKAIGKDAFTNTKYYNATENWNESGLYIGNHLIKANTDLSGSHIIKDGTMCIADEAFANNKNLTVVRMPSSVTHIGNNAFYNCQNLQRVVLGDETKSIGNSAFEECIKLAMVNIPDSIDSIGDRAFAGCTALTSFVLSENSNLTFLGESALAGCSALIEAYLPDSLNAISSGLFSSCTSLKTVKLPQSASTMGDSVFYYCPKLEAVDIPDGIKYIRKNTFYRCDALTEIIIPDSIETIEEYAFASLINITEITIPENVKTIGDYAFHSCSKLADITIPNGVTSIGLNVFYGTAYYKNNSNWVNGVLYIDNHLIKANSVSGAYEVKSGTKTIADYAFEGCASLTSINIPEGLVSIGNDAFWYCSALETIYIPSTVKKIGTNCFYSATFLNDVYYNGCEKDWDKIDVGPDNEYLLNAIFHFTHYYITWVVDGVETEERIAVGAQVNVPADPSKDYYTFSGWDKQAPATMPEKNYVITAQFTPITYYATFVIDGETFATVPYTVETETIENPVLPKKVGYTETWESYTLTPGGITVDAVYTVIIYNAVFTADGKTVSTIPYTVETESITSPAIPEKAGYTSKWADYDFAIGGVTVNAIYTPITYYANFVIDGETVATIPYTVETESINAPELPVREGYTEMWEDYELVIGGVTVNAVYTINPHTVTWIVDNEETTDNYEYGDTIVKPANPEKEGYTFTGWTPSVPATVPDEDLVFTATWKVNNYTVTWNVDGVIKTENYDYGTKIVKPSNPVKEGYMFIGWTNDVPATMPANDLEFVAEWSINPHTVTWVIDGNETVDTYNFGDTIVKLADPEKEGYSFTGWNAEIPATVPDEDLTFTATWKVNNYTVTWNVDGVITSETYDYGTEIIAPETPVKEGYTFKDWAISVPSTMPATNLDFVATWDINTYTITWNIGDTVETTDFNYGESVVSPEVNVEGYEFIKWIPDVPETMPAENLEFTATLASTAFDSGWGTEDNPYIISTKEQLDEARNHLGSSFKLANDIVFTENDFASGGAFYNSGRGWTPIHLNGTFDGNGHVIKGLKINARITVSTEYPYVGLFGLVSGTIKNLGLIDGEINVIVSKADEAFVGSIAGYADADSVIENCFNTCDINISSDMQVINFASGTIFAENIVAGGIIGIGPAKIKGCFNTGDVTISSSVYIHPSDYYNSYAKVEVMPIAGGITGGSSSVKECYNTGNIDVKITATGVTEDRNIRDYTTFSPVAGGISGIMSDISDCYNEGDINAIIDDSYNSKRKEHIALAGGISAGTTSSNTIINCYNTGKVTGSTCSGAITAYNEGVVEDCYYLNNNDTGVGQGTDNTLSLSPDKMASGSSYKGFDFENMWEISVNGTPKLKNNTSSTEKVEISDAELSVTNKETAQLTADLFPAYSTYKGIIWSSSNEEVATVDENGLITAKKIGETTVKATSADGKAFAECIVTVTPADFTVTWIVDGKETEETVTETNTIVKPETPVKYGYTFSGWTPDVPDVMPDENLTFNGSFIPVECELIFDATIGAFADGTTKKTETVDFDTQINAPEAPSKAGYIFLGWALDNVNVGTDLGIMDDVEGKRFTAVWVPSTDTRYAVETYTMNTEGEYVKTVQNFTGETDSTANAEYNIKTGFTLNDEKSVLSGTITADNSLVLKVYIDRNKYTFAMVVDGVSTETEYYYESVIAEPATPSKTGYTFIDWDKSVPASMPAKDVTITAEFDANSYDAIFNANGGKWSDGLTSKTAATDFDSEIIAPANPTRQGYDFAGWDNEIGIMDDVNGKTFNAKWNARNDTKYTVEVYTMGTDGKYFVSRETETGTTDTEVSASPTESTGFTFNSAKSTLSGNIAADGSLVLSIYYDRNTYTFATVIDEKTTSYDYYFDATVIKPANPVKPGYKFIGWDNTIPSKMLANDVTVTAKFELSFKMSIRNPSTTTIKYGDKIILHADMNEALPNGWTVKWTADNGNFSYSVSADGSTCTISPSKSGSTNFKATVYDEKGNVFCEDTQSMTSKAGFFDKIGAFFRKLFGSTKTFPQLFKGIF